MPQRHDGGIKLGKWWRECKMLMGIGPNDEMLEGSDSERISGSCNDKQCRGVCFNGRKKQVDLKEPGRPGICFPVVSFIHYDLRQDTFPLGLQVSSLLK